MLKLLFIITFSIQCYAQVDIVFDIDGTLAYSIKSPEKISDKSKLIRVENEYYILSEGAQDVIDDLSQRENVRISFFSGGTRKRNESLLKQITLPNSKVSFYDIAYKVKSREDFITVSDNKLLRPSQRFKKDLKLINHDLSQVILVDDISYFTLPEQQKNVFWIGKSYEYTKNFEQNKLTKRYPKKWKEWLREKNKMLLAHRRISRALSQSAKNGSSILEEIQKAKKQKISLTETINKLNPRALGKSSALKYQCYLPFIGF